MSRECSEKDPRLMFIILASGPPPKDELRGAPPQTKLQCVIFQNIRRRHTPCDTHVHHAHLQQRNCTNKIAMCHFLNFNTAKFQWKLERIIAIRSKPMPSAHPPLHPPPADEHQRILFGTLSRQTDGRISKNFRKF